MANMKIAYDLAVYKEDYKPSFISEALNEQINELRIANNAMNKSKWREAFAVFNIFEKELFKNEKTNNTEKDFAKFLGISQSQLSAYKNAVRFATTHEELFTRDNSGHINGGLKVSKADILQRIDKLDEFDAWCMDNYNTHVWYLGDNSIKKLLGVFNKPQLEDKAEDTAEDKAEDTAEDKAEDKAETKTEPKTNISIIDAKGYKVDYDDIPNSVLNKVMDILGKYRVATYNPDGEKIEA